MTDGSGTLAEAIDTIEQAYEFMLAFAAQGRRGGDDEEIRRRLQQTESALTVIVNVAADQIAGAPGEFIDLLKQDAGSARGAVRFVLAQPSIGSQIIDNLNATTHIRTLLTDLFLLDEAAKFSGS